MSREFPPKRRKLGRWKVALNFPAARKQIGITARDSLLGDVEFVSPPSYKLFGSGPSGQLKLFFYKKYKKHFAIFTTEQITFIFPNY